jgi:hypothetical protein
MRDYQKRLTPLRRIVLAGVLAGACAVVQAAVKGPDAAGYTATDGTLYSFLDISGAGGGASVMSGTDDGMAALTLPFAFTFYGQAYSTVCVSTNGALYFVPSAGACTGTIDFANTDLTGTAAPNDWPAALPFWNDLTFDQPGAGGVYYQALGAAGSRRFVVQWQNAYPQGSTNPVTFQLVLTEGVNSILFQYKTVDLGTGDLASKGGRATIGIRNTGAPANGQVLQWSYGVGVVENGTAIALSAGARYTFTGFLKPVDNPPTVNLVKAGSAIPLKWSLGGYQGMDVIAPGYPTSMPMASGGGQSVTVIEQTTTAGSSGLAYDAATGQYIYVWKTDKSWAGTSRQLVIKLKDNSYHEANFTFTR